MGCYITRWSEVFKRWSMTRKFYCLIILFILCLFQLSAEAPWVLINDFDYDIENGEIYFYDFTYSIDREYNYVHPLHSTIKDEIT